jgi:sugar O-acyltransferase (sialic acid O-acetyltransferase NeuD family)
MPLQKVVILGAGGFARETLDILDAVNGKVPTYDMIGYIVDPEFGSPGTIINGKPILGGNDWVRGNKEEVVAICAVGAPEVRLRMVRRAREAGVRFCTIIHPSAIVTRWVAFGEGTVVAAGCILSNQIRIGNHVHLNPDCTVGHDAILQDYASLAPGVHVSGNVLLGEGSYIGTGANLIEKVRIGPWSIVGAGSTVIADIPSNVTAVGVPAKVVKTRREGWHLA